MSKYYKKAIAKPVYISLYGGGYNKLVAVKKAMCEDGKRRYATITAEPDTFFSVPAQVKYNGKTVSGYVTGCEGPNGERDWEFRTVMTGKNYVKLESKSS